ncbi:hypothetical protein Tco_0061724, partial [Tanacetum coccineum]
DSDSHREEIDIFPGPDDIIPLEIKRDDYDSEDDENSTVDEPVLLHTPFPDEDECFDPGGNNDEIDCGPNPFYSSCELSFLLRE